MASGSGGLLASSGGTGASVVSVETPTALSIAVASVSLPVAATGSSPSHGARSPPAKKVLQRQGTIVQSSQTKRITVYVSTCQLPPSDSAKDVGLWDANTKFKPDVFEAPVSVTAKLESLQRFLLSQWVIAKSGSASIPLEEHFYTFNGRIMRLDAAIDTYCTLLLLFCIMFVCQYVTY